MMYLSLNSVENRSIFSSIFLASETQPGTLNCVHVLRLQDRGTRDDPRGSVTSE